MRDGGGGRKLKLGNTETLETRTERTEFEECTGIKTQMGSCWNGTDLRTCAVEVVFVSN